MSARTRLLLALGAFLLTVVSIYPAARTLPQHPDEGIWAWTGLHIVENAEHGDLNPFRLAPPGWSPLQTPMTGPVVYGLVVQLAGLSVPAHPHNWDTEGPTVNPSTLLPRSTLAVVRVTGIVAGAVGLALLAFRLGWTGLLGVSLFLAIPHVPGDLGVVAVDNFLLLGLGVSALAYGSRLFPLAAAFAAACKLNGLIVWPLLLYPKANGGIRPLFSLGFSWLAWTILTPASWFRGGPDLLPTVVVYLRAQSAVETAEMFDPAWSRWLPSVLPWIYLPTHYLLPFELGACLAIAALLTRWLTSARARPTPCQHDQYRTGGQTTVDRRVADRVSPRAR